MTVDAALVDAGIVPVVVIDDVARAAPLGHALRDGGLTCIEVTLRTPAGLRALAELAVLDGLTVGAGTVIDPQQVEQCLEAGAQFIVSPGYDSDIVDACRDAELLCLPGVATATELQRAYRAGSRLVKFFPAEQSGGLPAVQALAGPFADVRFMPTGGIGPYNAGRYLGCAAVIGVGATWVSPRDLIRDSEFERIRRLAVQARELVTSHRSATSD
jgi:2-dehydro-3-deoxyphosphogluconate aldolase / (4S)-4-hydroxy-2-oxoglutarate aldolase